MTIASSDKFKKTVAAGLATLLLIASAASIDFNPEKTAHLDNRTLAVSMLTDLTPDQSQAVKSHTTYTPKELQKIMSGGEGDIYSSLGNPGLIDSINKSAKDIINLLQSKAEINKQTFAIGLDGGLVDIQNETDNKTTTNAKRTPKQLTDKIINRSFDKNHRTFNPENGIDVQRVFALIATHHALNPGDFTVSDMVSHLESIGVTTDHNNAGYDQAYSAQLNNNSRSTTNLPKL